MYLEPYQETSRQTMMAQAAGTLGMLGYVGYNNIARYFRTEHSRGINTVPAPLRNTNMVHGRPKGTKKACDQPQFDGLNLSVIASGSVPLYVNNVRLGSELYQRVGRKIYMKNIHFKFWINIDTLPTLQNLCEFILIYDTNPNGASATYANIFKDCNATGATNTIQSGVNLDNRERFAIIRHECFNLNINSTLGRKTSFDESTKANFYQEFFVDLHGLETVFNNLNGGTQADLQTGGLAFFLVCSSSGTDWNYSFSCRLRYYD